MDFNLFNRPILSIFIFDFILIKNFKYDINYVIQKNLKILSRKGT